MGRENFGGVDGDAAKRAFGEQISSMDVAKAQVLGELAQHGLRMDGVKYEGQVPAGGKIETRQEVKNR